MTYKEREALRQKYLALATEHEKKIAHLPEWAKEPQPLFSEYSPPAYYYERCKYCGK